MEKITKEVINFKRRDIIEKIVADYMEYDEAKIRRKIDTIYYGAFQQQ